MSSRSSSSYPEFKSFHRVGFVAGAHGIRGEVFVRLFAGAADWRTDSGVLHLLPDGATALSKTDVRALKLHKDGFIVTLAGVPDRNAAERLKGAQVYIDEALLESEPGEAIFLREVLGFTLIDLDDAPLGEVVDFATNGQQDLLVVRRADSGKRALVPFVEAFVVDINVDARTVRVDLPEGLLTLGD